ncbi:hypothetical protein AA313_de0200957 [Arthrobotrys entomopaga]|nr:hypothetical protein AA313_de0200957 [Arthrobotrys entomopaga]
MMSLGLPTLVPRDTQSLWYTPSHTFGYTAPPKPSSSNIAQANQQQSQLTNQHGNHHHHHHQQHRTQRDATRSALATYGPSSLQQLAIDEDAVRKRRLHIARFGATWIKPPGMMKTLQGLIDEELERAEQMVMDDDGGITVTQDVLDPGPQHVEVGEEGEEEEEEGEGGEGGVGLDLEVDGGEEGLMEEGEVDLDADIPEADSTGWTDGEDEEEEEEEDDEEEDDEEEEADLDDDIPEADVSIYEEDEEDEEEDEEEEGEEDEEISDAEVDELSAIADTTQGSIDDSYASEVGDGSPQPVTPAHGGRRGTPTPTPSGRPFVPGQNRRGFRVQPARGSPLGRQRVVTPTTRTTRRSRGSQAANSSIMFMSGDEMEVDE